MLESWNFVACLHISFREFPGSKSSKKIILFFYISAQIDFQHTGTITLKLLILKNMASFRAFASPGWKTVLLNCCQPLVQNQHVQHVLDFEMSVH